MLKGEKVSKYFVTDDLINFLCIPISFKMHENFNNGVWEEKGKIFS